MEIGPCSSSSLSSQCSLVTEQKAQGRRTWSRYSTLRSRIESEFQRYEEQWPIALWKKSGAVAMLETRYSRGWTNIMSWLLNILSIIKFFAIGADVIIHTSTLQGPRMFYGIYCRAESEFLAKIYICPVAPIIYEAIHIPEFHYDGGD